MFQFHPFSVPLTAQVGLNVLQVTVSTSHQINALEPKMKIYMTVIHCLCRISNYKKKLLTF